MDTVSSPDSSLYENKYFLTILDDHTRYSWVHFFKSKDQVYNTFLKWYKKIQNIFNSTIKFIRTDNGTEFVNRDFNNFCTENGIINQLTVPHNPQQNGRAERLNETFIYTAASLLTESKLNRKFWEDAIHTTNYIHNRLPHKGINNQVPFEILFNEKVNYNHFKVFGCQVFFYVPKHFRKKFTDSTLPGIFLGYDGINHTAYRIFDISNNKVVLSRAVSFFEDVPGNSPAPFSIPEFLNILDINKLGGNDSNLIIDNDQYSLGEEVLFENFINNPINHNLLNQNSQNQNNLNLYNENSIINPNTSNQPLQPYPQSTNFNNFNSDRSYSENKNNNYLNNTINLNNNSSNNSNNLIDQQMELNENNPNTLNQNNQGFNSKNQNFNFNTNKDLSNDKFENKQHSVNDEDNKKDKEKNNNNPIDTDSANNDINLNNLKQNLEQNENKNINNSKKSNTNIDNKKNNVVEVNNKNNEYNNKIEIIGVDRRKATNSNRKKNAKNSDKQHTRINNKMTNKRKRKDKEIIEESNSTTKRIKSFNIEDIIDIVSNLTVSIPTEPINYNDIFKQI